MKFRWTFTLDEEDSAALERNLRNLGKAITTSDWHEQRVLSARVGYAIQEMVPIIEPAPDEGMSEEEWQIVCDRAEESIVG